MRDIIKDQILEYVTFFFDWVDYIQDQTKKIITEKMSNYVSIMSHKCLLYNIIIHEENVWTAHWSVCVIAQPTESVKAGQCCPGLKSTENEG